MKQIDHKDGDPLNNEPSNLRVVAAESVSLEQRLVDESCGFGIGHALLMQEAAARITELEGLVDAAPEPYAEVWRKIDDDGKPAGNTYAERGMIDMIEPPPHPALRSMNAADFAARLVRLSYAEHGELEDALLEAALRIDERQNWLCPECQCQINDADGVTSCPNCGWSEEDET